VKVKTSELTGRAIDWATGKAIGANIGVTIGGLVKEITSHNPIEMGLWQPTNDWSICGSMIEKYWMDVFCEPHNEDVLWSAITPHLLGNYENGPTPQIAICRAVVASVLGDEIDLPEDLQ
jgi:hypothetical protein